MPVNVFAISWFVRGLRGNSIIFAVLFAFFVCGFSLSHEIDLLLLKLGVHWLVALILPFCIFAILARFEDRIFPNERLRKLWARCLLAGSLLAAVLIAWLKHR